jgi:preprotein translocase subunit YajC
MSGSHDPTVEIFQTDEEIHMSPSEHQESGPVRASDDPFSVLHRRRRGVRVTTAAAVALGLALGGGAVAGAATGSSTSTTNPPGHSGFPGGHAGFGGTPPAAFGTVKTVGSGSFTVASHDGTTVTVDVSSSTTYTDPSVTSPTFSTIKVGDHVAVFGTDTSDTVTATKVAIGGPDGPGGPGGPDGPGGPGRMGGPGGFSGTPPAAFGTVKSVGSGSFTLASHDGTTVTVDVSSSTTYREPGKASATLADVTVGAQVAVFGTDVSDTVTATSVGIGRPGDGPSGSFHPGGPGSPGSYPPHSSSSSSSSETTSSSAWGNSTVN